MAMGYIIIAFVIAISSGLYFLAGIKTAFVLKALVFISGLAGYLSRVMLGYLIVNIFTGTTSPDADEQNVKRLLRLSLWGATILAGLSFVIESFWKGLHFGKMACFFNISGYPVWFLYLIMIAEALGGLGILLHFKLKTGPVAAAGLMLIMIGALYTHSHNKDPLADSYAAIGEFITLGLMQALYYFEQAVKPHSSNYSLSPEHINPIK
jgi:uncharacterized membrane protein YphA (DoxX/SURF4 family)